MKTLLVLLLSCSALFSETKAEADLRQQLEAAKIEIAARDAHIKSLQAGQKKLTEAVVVQAETSKENNKKIEAATNQIIKSEADGKKLVETVTSQAAATQDATAQLTDEVKISGFAVKSAVMAQTKQQEKALLAARDAAREVARKLDASNAELAETKREDAARLDETNKRLENLIHQNEVAAARDERGNKHDQWAFWMVAVPIFGAAITSLIGILINKRLSRTEEQNTLNGVTLTNIETKQGETHELVNGRYTKLEAEKEALKAQLAEYQRLDASKGLR
jgi:hypothetical protein